MARSTRMVVAALLTGLLALAGASLSGASGAAHADVIHPHCNIIC